MKKKKYTMSASAMAQRRKAGFKPTGRATWKAVRMPAWALAQILAATPRKDGATWLRIHEAIIKEGEQ